MSTVSGRKYTVSLGDRSFAISVSQSPTGEIIAVIDGERVPVEAVPLGPHAYSLLMGHESLDIGVAPSENGWTVTHANLAHEFDIGDEALVRFRKAAGTKASGKDVLKAPMPGLVVGVNAAVGDSLAPGAPLIVLEAMKMQNELASKHGGTVEAIKVQVGDKVDKGQVLAILTA